MLPIQNIWISYVEVNKYVLKLHKVLHTPKVSFNMLLVHQLCVDIDLSIKYSTNDFSIKKDT